MTIFKFIWYWLRWGLIIAAVLGGLTFAWGTVDYFGLTGSANQAHVKNDVLPVALHYIALTGTLFHLLGSNQFLGLMSVMAAGFSAWAAVVSAKIGKKALEKDRAWLLIHDFQVDESSSETHTIYRAIVTNYGHTPALKVIFIMNLIIWRERPVMEEGHKGRAGYYDKNSVTWIAQKRIVALVPQAECSLEFAVSNAEMVDVADNFRRGRLRVLVDHGVVTDVDNDREPTTHSHIIDQEMAIVNFGNIKRVAVDPMKRPHERLG